MEFINYYFNYLLTGLALTILCVVGSAVGVFIHLQRKSLIADALAHGMLPGICAAFLLVNDKDDPLILLGGGIAALFCYYLVEWVIGSLFAKADAAIAAIMSGFFGLGILLITYIQRNPDGNSTGLDRILFGSAAALTTVDLFYISIVSIPAIIYLVLFRKSLLFQIFDQAFLSISGISDRWSRVLLNVITVSVVILGVKSLGVILISSVIILPSSIASLLTRRGHLFFYYALLIGLISGLFGVTLSTFIPRLSTGPVVVLSMGLLFIIALALAPEVGIVSSYMSRLAHLQKVKVENVLKVLYLKQINGEAMPLDLDRRIIRFIYQQNLIYSIAKPALTSTGVAEARRVVRLHRLWELYLSRKMDFATDHLHQDADAIEHIITPEIEAELIKTLNRPEQDPHQSEIPY